MIKQIHMLLKHLEKWKSTASIRYPEIGKYARHFVEWSFVKASSVCSSLWLPGHCIQTVIIDLVS